MAAASKGCSISSFLIFKYVNTGTTYIIKKPLIAPATLSTVPIFVGMKRVNINGGTLIPILSAKYYGLDKLSNVFSPLKNKFKSRTL
jgi:hypothetical protein